MTKLERTEFDGKTPSLRWWARWGPALFMMALIFVASGTPGQDLPEFDSWSMWVYKGGHMLGYALLAMSYRRGWAGSRKGSRSAALLAVILAILYALTDEYHQSLTPGRNSRLSDVGIDTAGAILGVGILTAIQSRR
jgi:VanZ family protein